MLLKIMLWFAFFVATQAINTFAAPCDGPDPLPDFSEGGALPIIRIADVAFTLNVQNNCPTERLDIKINKPEKLYLWMRLEGGTNALNLLRRDGRLPLKHTWIARVASRRYTDGQEEISIADGIINDVRGLESEVRRMTVFDWRTNSAKSRLFTNASYLVEIRDNRNTPIPCADNLDCEPCDNGIKCGIRMTIN